MPFALTIAVFIIFFNILMWVVFFKKFNAFFSTDKIIEETNEKAKEIIKSINFNAGRSIDLIEDKIKQLKAVSAEAERKIGMLKKELSLAGAPPKPGILKNKPLLKKYAKNGALLFVGVVLGLLISLLFR